MSGAAETLLHAALTNAAGACLLAGIAFALTRLIRHPPLAHFLWMVVLLKLITPPILTIPGTGFDLGPVVRAALPGGTAEPPSAADDRGLEPRGAVASAEMPAAGMTGGAVTAGESHLLGSIPVAWGELMESAASAAPTLAPPLRAEHPRALASRLAVAAWLGVAALILGLGIARAAPGTSTTP